MATTEDLARLLVSIEFTQKQAEIQLAAIANGIAQAFANYAKEAEEARKQTEGRYLGALC